MEPMKLNETRQGNALGVKAERSTIKFTAPVIKEDSDVREEADVDYAVADSTSVPGKEVLIMSNCVKILMRQHSFIHV